MQRKVKELMLIKAFGLNISDAIKYEDYLGHEGTSTIIETQDLRGEDCLMLLHKNGSRNVIEDILEVSYGSDYYILNNESRKERQRKAFELLDVHIGDKVKRYTNVYTCEELSDQILLMCCRVGMPVGSLYRFSDWEKIQ